MKVIAPLTGESTSITEAMLISSTVPETEPQWNAATTYQEGDLVRGNVAPYLHRMFMSLEPNNLNNPITNPLKWVDAGPTNRWAAYDLLRNTGSVSASPQVHVIEPGQRIDAVGLAGVEADEVKVEVIRDGIVIMTRVESMSTRVVNNYYDYFFAAFSFKKESAFFDLPPYTDAQIRVTLTRSSGNVTCGAILMNMSVYIGDIEPSAEDDEYNYSVIERDEAGSSVLVPKRSIPRTNQVLWIDKAYVQQARQLRTSLNAVPAMWVGLEDTEHAYFPSLLVLGIFKKFSINLDYETLARIALELEDT